METFQILAPITLEDYIHRVGKGCYCSICRPIRKYAIKVTMLFWSTDEIACESNSDYEVDWSTYNEVKIYKRNAEELLS